MEFSINHPILFVIVGVIIAVVLAQSVYFLVKSYRRAKAIGMDMSKVKKTIVSSSVFTVAPAVSIVITVLALSKSLGVALPWLRLSVVGSLSYETIAAENAASGMGTSLSELAVGTMTASQFVTIAVVMTVSILVGIWLVPVIGKRMSNGLVSFEKRDKKWMDTLQSAMFIGMISAFVGYVFCDVSRLWLAEDGVFTVTDTVKEYVGGELVEKTVTTAYSATSGLIPVFVMAVSAVGMVICGILMKKLNWKWLNDYALPICMILGMASAIPLTAWLG
ncbi:MAG: DUF5058 family protein [Clostridia bacterium]|nr:DUF5058 family protein [Clostridia bacterium]